MNDDFSLTTARVRDAVRRALEEDFHYDYNQADKLFQKWLTTLTDNQAV